MDITIILTNLLAYMLKLEKQSRQAGNSSFYNFPTNVIWNTTFASRCLQVIGNLRVASLLFDQVYSAKLFKASSYTEV